MSQRPEEIPALTGVRAYAAVWVMLLHLQFSAGVGEHVRLGPVIGHGAWAVDIFFVLSGFILSLLYAPRLRAAEGGSVTYWNYLVARFARIYPLHLATLAALAVFFVARYAVRHEAPPPGANLYHLLLNLTLLHGWGFAERLNWNYPSWSISCEWFAYLVMLPLLVHGLARRSLGLACFVAGAAWLAVYIFIHGLGGNIREQAIDWALTRIAAEFTLGYALYRVYQRFRMTSLLADAMTLTGAAAIVALTLLPDALEILLAPAVMLLILGLSQAGPIGRALFASRFAVFWGERSYSIYMLHAVVQFYAGHLVVHFGIKPSPAGSWLLLLLLSALVLLASHLAYGWIELPMRSRVRKALSRGEARAPAVPVAGAELRP